jgi:hypothetical protein
VAYAGAGNTDGQAVADWVGVDIVPGGGSGEFLGGMRSAAS